MATNKYITLALWGLMLAGCTREDIAGPLERLPLSFAASLTDKLPLTRSTGSEFEQNDQLLCYVRHIVTGVTDPVQARMVTIMNGEPTEALYWDDFSESTAGGEKDLRTGGHGLQSFYGYCYNGGTPATTLAEATGVLGWETPGDQRAAGTVKANDLLWSGAQPMLGYDHAKDAHGTLEIPFTHAMSKFTVVVVAKEGFEQGDLDQTTVTLHGISLSGTFSAPTSSVTVSGTTSVKMYANEEAVTGGKPSRTYEAMTVPLTALTEGALLATIGNADGNVYKVYLNSAILSGWASGIQDGKSRSGVNYKLTVTLNKQKLGVVATLAGWTDVSASETGRINFSADVTSIDKTNDVLTGGDTFSLWMSADKSAMGGIVSTPAYDASTHTWNNDTDIYWPDGTTSLYFRALAKKTAAHALEAVTETTAAKGKDLLWGTTAAHTGTEADGTTTHPYAEGEAINPRTGRVPLVFKHAMSNVVVALTTGTGASAVDFTGATITLTKVTTDGSISIAEGTLGPGSTVESCVVARDAETIMVPQDIDADARLIVTLQDNTTYSLPLGECTDGTRAITRWESGSKYTYTITVNKQEIGLRALIEDWNALSGSGHANLDWD